MEDVAAAVEFALPDVAPLHSTSDPEHACLQPDDPLSLAITCVMTAHLEAHLGEAQLYDAPRWLVHLTQWNNSPQYTQRGS